MSEQVRETVEAGEAKSVRALMQMGFGHLALKGGAEALFEGQFEFPDAAWRPEVTYEVTEGLGTLMVKQPDDLRSFGNNKKGYIWDLALGNQVPLELALRIGSGDADLRLADVRAVLLEAAVGSGQVQADLTGAVDLRNVDLKAGSGRVGLIFGGEYAHLANVEVNVASGLSDVTIGGVLPALKHIKINGASGRIALQIPGTCQALKKVSLNTASGTVDLGLLGSLPDDVEIGIHCVSGVATVRVPASHGVAVRFSSVTGKVKAPGFHKENGLYVSDRAVEGAPVLHLRMSTVSGELILQPAES